LKNEKLITKYRTYVDNEISKVYTDNNLTVLKEFKNLTETLTAYDKNRNSLKREKRYADSSYSNGILKSYKNDKLVDEIVFENSMPKLKKMYYDDGNLAFEFPKNYVLEGGNMKKIFIVLTFIFISLLSYSKEPLEVEIKFFKKEKTELSFNKEVALGLIKIKEKNNPRYEKFLDYIDNNLQKKGKVKYSTNLNFEKICMEIFSEDNKLLCEIKLPDEFSNILNEYLSFTSDKEEAIKFLKETLAQNSNLSITKNNGKIKILEEFNSIQDGHKIKSISEIILKKELNENQKQTLLSLKGKELINKYKNYMESDISKNYTDDKLTSIIEYKNSTLESITIFEENNNFKQEIEYTDSKQLNGTFRRYENDKIIEEIIFENNLPKLKKLYHQNGNLAVEMPVKNGKVDGEVKSYYENGNIQSILYYKNGFLIYENGKPKGVRY